MFSGEPVTQVILLAKESTHTHDYSLLMFRNISHKQARVSAHDALHLTVDIPTKAERQWPAEEDGRVALATSSSTGFRRMRTLYCIYLRCGDLRSPGATELRNGSLGQRDDDDDDEG